MKISRIEIFGFKSFLERVILPVPKGITVIVGPNGCGKSNVVDALRWVMGESRAHALRGDLLEDVIFGGTENLKPLGLAEVSLTLTTEGGLPGEEITGDGLFGEATVANLDVAESTGQSSFENNEPTAGVLVEDSANSEARIEDLDNKKNTHLASDSEQTFKDRFSWIGEVEEIQITRRLYRSGDSEYFINRVPCRLRDVKELCRAVGLGARSYTVVAQGEVGRIVNAKPEERRLILEEAAGIGGLREKLHTAERRLEETSANSERMKDVVAEVARQVGSLKVQASRAKMREELKSRLRELDLTLAADSLFETKGKREPILKEKEELELRIKEIESGLSARRKASEDSEAKVRTLENEERSVRSNLRKMEEEFRAAVKALESKRLKLAEIRTLGVARKQDLDGLKVRESEVLKKVKEATDEVAAGKAAVAAIADQIRLLPQGQHTAVEEASAKLERLRETLRAHDARARAMSDKVHELRGKWLALKAQLQELTKQKSVESFINGGVQTLGSRPLVEYLSVPADLMLAVQAALGSASDASVVDGLVDKLSSAIANNSAILLPKGVMLLEKGCGSQARQQSESLQLPTGTAGEPAPESPKRLLDCIKVEQEASALAERVLGNFYLALSLDQALKFISSADLAESNTRSAIFVTKNGEIVSREVVSRFSSTTGALQLSSQVRGYEADLGALTLEVAEKGKERKLIEESIAQSKMLQDEALKRLHEHQERERELKSKLAEASARQRGFERLMEEARREEFAGINRKVELEKIIARLGSEEQNLSSELSLQSEGWFSEQGEIRAKLENELRTFEERMLANREERQEIVSSLRTLEAERETKRERSHFLHRQLGELDYEQRHLVQRIIDAYGEDSVRELHAVAVAVNPEEKPGLLQEQQRLRARLHREGEVDPTSIERFAAEESRLKELQLQADDMEKARAALLEGIMQLKNKSQERFLASFYKIKDNFSALVPRLFGGGRASLELTDRENPLESGVEIIVRPPGKNLKAIDLLSGGEKALTATALIFSMFLERPSPLCVLDEVDAPLDESNNIRLLEVIREWSKKTQFLVITHSKSTMNVADRLVGVTMETPGASKVVSVTLEQAVERAMA